MGRRAPNSRPVHPCYLSVWEGNAGSEFSTWAKITNRSTDDMPDLVTAQGSTLTIYSIEPATGKLLFVETFPNLYGNVCFLETLHSPDGDGSDALLLGFAGHPRLAVVTIKATSPKLLLGTTLFDLTLALQELSYGSITPLEQDLQATLWQKPVNTATVSVTLGGGVALACLQLRHTSAAGWHATDEKPYLLPLQSLSVSSLEEKSGPANGLSSTQKDLTQSIMTGFGDILSTAFLPGYLEPTMVILHSNPHSGGRAWPGRLGREAGGTRHAMELTAVTVTVSHHRSAILWSTQVPADALQVYPTGEGCMVHCTNSLLAVSNTGQIQQCLAANGWAPATMASDVTVQANPWPFPKLAVALDGAQISFVTEKAAFCVLRYGQVFLLQYTTSWSLLPLYKNIGAIGQIANLSCWPLGNMFPSKILESKLGEGQEKSKLNSMETGLLFAGSRLGDSSLLGYALETISMADAMEGESVLQNPILESTLPEEHKEDATDTEYDRILQLEEDALYAAASTADGDGPALIPASDDDEESKDQTMQQRKRARLSHLVVTRALTILDSLTALGPLGPGCLGPVSKAIKPDKDEGVVEVDKALSFGSSGYIFPCGYGSSGGLALLTAPGREDSSIVAEEDCINAKAIFNLPSRGLVALSMGSGIKFLRLDRAEKTTTGVKAESDEDSAEDTATLEEIDLEGWCSEETLKFVLSENAMLMMACEIDDEDFGLLFSTPVSESAMEYYLFVLSDTTGTLSVKTKTMLPIPTGSSIRTVTPFKKDINTGNLILACTLSSGDARLFSFDKQGKMLEQDFDAEIPMEIESKEDNEEEIYYASGKVVAVDIFEAPKAFFATTSSETGSVNPTATNEESNDLTRTGSTADDDDQELYGGSNTVVSDETKKPQPEDNIAPNNENESFLGLCRQSGKLEVYAVSDLASGQEVSPIWTAFGASHGIPQLQSQRQGGSAYRVPRSHKVCASEIRFFFCGPSSTDQKETIGGPRVFCLAVETNDGDTLLYSADISHGSKPLNTFSRVPMKNVTRPSQEQAKHFSKLRRKGMVGGRDESDMRLRRNRLFPFQNLSGQDGLFAAVARPLWFVAERGRLAALYHRSRHAAPAGASSRPVTAFCSGLLKTDSSEESGFITIHERVGRVGSQRITVFNSLLNLATAHGILPGGGVFVQKIPLGVTVKRIQFIEGAPGSNPLYAVLVSREIETDLSNLNDDGLTQEEHQDILEEKENAKIKRQVEADLGGFDIEQEWVEEIERESCFKVDMKLGGAPPIQKSAYSLWIVDAASGWVVVDTYEFEEYEHAISMQVMYLSEFMEEPGAANEPSVSEEDLESRPFIAVGTATVDKDGEDVSSKGRVLLFEVNKASKLSTTSQTVELSFVYEKSIFHGPVTSLSCLVSEGKKRLVIGAGADINVEQWGADKLTQVGFYRATMAVLETKLFKNFMVLSDAYDSLHFLIWRESDKSLTLLAKDYDPIPVYAAGLLSRGGSLDIVCQDDRENLQFFQYAPGDAAARGGNRLVCRADFHLGSQTTDLQSFFCRSSLLINSATPSSSLAALKQQDKFYGKSDDDQRLGVHFGTGDGGYASVVPLSEPIYWRLTALQSVMVNALESDCSLSQRAWRLYRRTARRGGCRSNERKKGVIDGDLVTQYADLSIADQEDLASAIGSTVDLILDNLLELRCSTMVI